MELPSDEIAIEQCRHGDNRGLETLVRRYQVAALRLAYLLTGNREQAQDIVQESFIMALHKVHQLRVGGSFGPWHHRIVVNMAHSYLRMPRQRHERGIDETRDDRPTTDPAALPDMTAERHETQSTLSMALGALTEKQREVIVLRYYLGYTDQEIASLLHCSHATVRQRVFAGRKALEAIIRLRYPWLIGEVAPLAESSPSLVEEI